MSELHACVRRGVRQLQFLLERNRVERVARDVEHVPGRVRHEGGRRIFGEELAQLGDVRLHRCDTGFRVLRPELVGDPRGRNHPFALHEQVGEQPSALRAADRDGSGGVEHFERSEYAELHACSSRCRHRPESVNPARMGGVMLLAPRTG